LKSFGKVPENLDELEIPHVRVTAALERERGDLVASVRFRNRRVGLTVHSVRRLVSKLLPLQSHFD
jgi:hypothetical protein